MNHPPFPLAQGADPRLRASAVRWTVIAFILLTIALCSAQRWNATHDYQSLIRAGVLRDLLGQQARGQQALVSSLRIMPLPTLAALPFTPVLRPSAYDYAYLYGLALLLALSVLPLARLIGRPLARQTAAAPLIALAFLLALAAGLGATAHTDLLACLACLIIAVSLEAEAQAPLRAVAGVFWGCALLAHLSGLILALGRALLLVLGRFVRRSPPEGRAIAWIQLAAIIYMAAVYLFLNWIIMNDPLYPARTSYAAPPCDTATPQLARLAGHFARRYTDAAPVVSGHWGYLLAPFLRRHGGYHYIDFYPDKLPLWDDRDFVLVQPAPGNPLVGLSDLGPPRTRAPSGLKGCFLLEETEGWRFYAIGLPAEHPR